MSPAPSADAYQINQKLTESYYKSYHLSLFMEMNAPANSLAVIYRTLTHNLETLISSSLVNITGACKILNTYVKIVLSWCKIYVRPQLKINWKRYQRVSVHKTFGSTRICLSIRLHFSDPISDPDLNFSEKPKLDSDSVCMV